MCEWVWFCWHELSLGILLCFLWILHSHSYLPTNSLGDNQIRVPEQVKFGSRLPEFIPSIQKHIKFLPGEQLRFFYRNRIMPKWLAGNESRNSIFLTNQRLIAVQEGKVTEISLSQLSNVKHKKTVQWDVLVCSTVQGRTAKYPVAHSKVAAFFFKQLQQAYRDCREGIENIASPTGESSPIPEWCTRQGAPVAARVAHEVMTSERTYVTKMSELVTEVLQPMRASCKKLEVSVGEIGQIFGTIEMLWNFHKVFLADLLATTDVQSLANVFATQVSLSPTPLFLVVAALTSRVSVHILCLELPWRLCVGLLCISLSFLCFLT